jgi:hypothetical protein
MLSSLDEILVVVPLLDGLVVLCVTGMALELRCIRRPTVIVRSTDREMI